MFSKIRGTGCYLPAHIRTNADLEHMVETNDAWITARTGIKERRIAARRRNSFNNGLPGFVKSA